MQKGIITQPEIYYCCNCNKVIDLINTNDSIYSCCSKQFSTCIFCAGKSCPKCHKQRTSRVFRKLLKAQNKERSKLNDDNFKFVSSELKANIPKESCILQRQKMMPVSHIVDSKTSENYQKNFLQGKSSQFSSTKLTCVSCCQQIPQFFRAKTQSTQFTVCKQCEESIKFYEQKMASKKLDERFQKRKQQKQQVKCESCQNVVPKDAIISQKDNSLEINLCRKCYTQYAKEQTRKLQLEKENNDKLRQNRKEKMEKSKQMQPQKIKECQQNKVQQSITDKILPQEIQSNAYKNDKQAQKQACKRQKITKLSLISVTIIQKSKIQDRRDRQRKFSIDQADQQLLDIKNCMPFDSCHDKVAEKGQNKFSKGKKVFEEYEISESSPNQFRECQVCKYLILQKDGFWSYKSIINKNHKKLLSQINDKQQKKKHENPRFMCLNCIYKKLEGKKIQKHYEDSVHKYF